MNSRLKEKLYTDTHLFMHLFIFIDIQMYVFTFMCIDIKYMNIHTLGACITASDINGWSPRQVAELTDHR
jgi:hypothetical protein